MNNINKYFKKFLKDQDNPQLRDILLLEMIFELQSIIAALLSRNSDPEVLKTTKEALTSLQDLNSLSEKTRKKLHLKYRKGGCLEQVILEEACNEE